MSVYGFGRVVRRVNRAYHKGNPVRSGETGLTVRMDKRTDEPTEKQLQAMLRSFEAMLPTIRKQLGHEDDEV